MTKKELEMNKLREELKFKEITCNETINQFMNLIRSIQNEKERRRELLNILESCARLRAEEDL